MGMDLIQSFAAKSSDFDGNDVSHVPSEVPLRRYTSSTVDSGDAPVKFNFLRKAMLQRVRTTPRPQHGLARSRTLPALSKPRLPSRNLQRFRTAPINPTMTATLSNASDASLTDMSVTGSLRSRSGPVGSMDFS